MTRGPAAFEPVFESSISQRRPPVPGDVPQFPAATLDGSYVPYVLKSHQSVVHDQRVHAALTGEPFDRAELILAIAQHFQQSLVFRVDLEEVGDAVADVGALVPRNGPRRCRGFRRGFNGTRRFLVSHHGWLVVPRRPPFPSTPLP